MTRLRRYSVSPSLASKLARFSFLANPSLAMRSLVVLIPRYTIVFIANAIKTNHGTPRGIRTPDLLVRSQALYPAELSVRDHVL